MRRSYLYITRQNDLHWFAVDRTSGFRMCAFVKNIMCTYATTLPYMHTHKHCKITRILMAVSQRFLEKTAGISFCSSYIVRVPDFYGHRTT